MNGQDPAGADLDPALEHLMSEMDDALFAGRPTDDFEREIADRPAAAVVGEWAPRLLPGAVGAATHGLIRTGHALRGLGEADTEPRRLEVANALAFWASSYRELPGPPLLIGHERVAEALADLPYLPEDAPRPMLISDRVAAVADIADEFEQAVASLGWTGGAVDLLDQLATGGALAYLRNADDGGVIGLLHAVTSPLACELVLPWLAEEDRDAALGYVWQAAAALHVAYDIDRVTPVPLEPAPASDDLIDAALASGDEHAINPGKRNSACPEPWWSAAWRASWADGLSVSGWRK